MLFLDWWIGTKCYITPFDPCVCITTDRHLGVGGRKGSFHGQSRLVFLMLSVVSVYLYLSKFYYCIWTTIQVMWKITDWSFYEDWTCITCILCCFFFAQPNTEQKKKRRFCHTFKAKRYFVTLSKQKNISSHFQSKNIFRHTFKANIYFVALSKQNYNFCHTFKAKRFHHAFKAKKDNKKPLQSRSLNLLHHTCTHHRYMNLTVVVLSISNLILSGFL